MSLDLTKYQIIPVVEIEKAEDAVPLAEALIRGGINIIEVTLRTDAALQGIQKILKHLPEFVVGAGTINTLQQAEEVCEAGVHFGVAPALNPDVVRYFKQKDIPFIPGIVTPSEIEAALSLQCNMLKFFPAEIFGGVQYVRTLAGPFKHRGLQICATGGVRENNFVDYLNTPMMWAVGGTWIAPRQDIASHEWTEITQRAEHAVSRLDEVRPHG